MLCQIWRLWVGSRPAPPASQYLAMRNKTWLLTDESVRTPTVWWSSSHLLLKLAQTQKLTLSFWSELNNLFLTLWWHPVLHFLPSSELNLLLRVPGRQHLLSARHFKLKCTKGLTVFLWGSTPAHLHLKPDTTLWRTISFWSADCPGEKTRQEVWKLTQTIAAAQSQLRSEVFYLLSASHVLISNC